MPLQLRDCWHFLREVYNLALLLGFGPKQCYFCPKAKSLPDFIIECAVVFNVWSRKSCHNRSLMLLQVLRLQSSIVCGVYSYMLVFPQSDFIVYNVLK